MQAFPYFCKPRHKSKPVDSGRLLVDFPGVEYPTDNFHPHIFFFLPFFFLGKKKKRKEKRAPAFICIRDETKETVLISHTKARFEPVTGQEQIRLGSAEFCRVQTVRAEDGCPEPPFSKNLRTCHHLSPLPHISNLTSEPGACNTDQGGPGGRIDETHTQKQKIQTTKWESPPLC